jgi:release factor glutamine methyltransferase
MRPQVAVLLREATARLAAAGIETARVDAVILAGHVLGASRGRVEAMALAGESLSAAQVAHLDVLVARRAGREPLQHVTGVAPFRTIVVEVGPGVFIPRPETEVVAGFAIGALRRLGPGAVGVDLGTGSGAIALAMAVEVPGSRIIAVEKSHAAWSFARRNIDRIAPAVSLVHADLTTALTSLDHEADVIVSNPPYVPARCRPADREARSDPARALYGGPDGLEVIRLIAARAMRSIAAGGVLVLEHGAEQGADVRGILTRHGWSAPATHRDLTGRDRVTIASRR